MTTIKVQADKPGAKINPAMWGIFFEDINFGADGGLYAELVKNRAFEFPDPLMGWTKISPSLARGEISVRDDGPFAPANPHYLRIVSEGTAPLGVSNEGFRGMGVRQGEAYHFSAQIRGVTGSPDLLVQLYGADGSLLDSVPLGGFSSDWKKYTADSAPQRYRRESAAGPPCRRQRCGGPRPGVALPGEDLEEPARRPASRHGADARRPEARLPAVPRRLHRRRQRVWNGVTSGRTPSARSQDRKLLINRWNYEFQHRPTPDYFQSFGLGFFEFFQLCEDIGAEPLPILNCGMACQFNSGELVPLDQLDPYIQDALDLIEFANGPATSHWGAKRVAMGHPEPFNMKMLGVGNEQWGPQYIERYASFAKVLKARHPEIMLVSAAGPSPADDRFHFLWPKLRELKADIVDEHCYANPIWFLANTHRYDNYDRHGPKVFMGEYAAQSVAIVSPKNRNNLECALAEAAYMTGLERNADVVHMASYAPLFAHVDAWQWTPNLIWCDNLRVYGTPNYYVQQLFSRNRGDVVLAVDLAGAELPSTPSGRVGLGTFQTTAEFKDVRVMRGDQTLLNSNFANGAPEWSGAGHRWTVCDGAYQQTDPGAPASVFAGDTSWSDYTLSLKARKLGGAEGFWIFVRQNGPENYIVWNLGGRGNQSHVLLFHLGQQDQFVSQVPGTIDTGRWYDVKIQLKGAKLDCYLDGKLVQSAEVPPPQIQCLYASAVRDEKTDEVILKVVNPGDEVGETQIHLAGLANVASEVKAITLTGANPGDVNSLDHPLAVAPAESTFNVTGPRFGYRFPQLSMTVLRIKAR